MEELKRTPEEIEQELDKVRDYITSGSMRFSGMTYAQGVEEAINWLLGEQEEAPMVDWEIGQGE